MDLGPNSPAQVSVNNDGELANIDAATDEDPSAADYDPILDRREDQARHDKRHEIKPEPVPVPVPVQPSTEPVEEEFDMFAEMDDDNSAPRYDNHAKRESILPKAKELDMSLLDNWDDPEGYYRIILGELIDGRYHVQANLGKGMFSAVVRALDSKTDKMVAIKIIRNNETMLVYQTIALWKVNLTIAIGERQASKKLKFFKPSPKLIKKIKNTSFDSNGTLITRVTSVWYLST